MSVCVVAGMAVGIWALLSVLSGERYRQQQELEAMRKTVRKAVEQDEQIVVSESRSH